MKIANSKTLIFSLFLSLGLHYASSSIAANTSSNALALSKAMLPEAQFKQMAEAIIQTANNAARAKIESEKLPIDMDKRGAEFEKSLKEIFTYDYFIALNAKNMLRNFDEGELGTVLAFYNAETGKKWTKNTGGIISDTMMQIQTDLQEHLPKIVDKMAGSK